jgi:hypothetical protein
MESSKKFVQNRTVFLSFASANTTAEINVPFAVDRVIFRSLADDAGTDAYGVLSSDLINWESIGVVFRNDAFSNSTAQTNEYHYFTPTKIQGRYNFTLRNLSGTPATVAGTESIVFIAEFIRDKDGSNGHSH